MTGENLDWNSATEARILAADLVRLSHMRDRADIRVRLFGSFAWLTWSSSRVEVVQALFPLMEVIFFRTDLGVRYRLGNRIPTDEVPPSGEDRPLTGVLVPLPIQTVSPDANFAPTVPVRLVRGGSPGPTTALLCDLDALRALADTATSYELTRIRGILCGDRAMLFGSDLPRIAGALRLYGTDLLLPVGYRTEPDLPAAVLRAGVGVVSGEVLIFTQDGIEIVPIDRAEPLTRAAIRIALAGVLTP